MQCSLCNELIEEQELVLGTVTKLEDELWHVECYAEYFDVVLEEV